MTKKMYLEETEFDTTPRSDYSVEVDEEGVIVYSECCADRMGLETTKLLYSAIGEYLDAQEQ